MSTVFSIKKKFDKFIASWGMSDNFDVPRKAHQRHSDAKCLMLADEIRSIVETDPGRSLRSSATEAGLARAQ
jgi:hypothetical protein